MEIKEDRWLTGVFGHGAFKVETVSGQSAEPLVELLAAHEKGRAEALYYAKVGAEDVRLLGRFLEAGFRVVDVNVTFGLDPARVARSKPASRPKACTIRTATPGDAQGVLAIAASCFQYSRFHLDPQISRKTADLSRREWIANYIQKKRGDALYAAIVKGRPAGFLAVLSTLASGRRTAMIDLIGVDRSQQGRGVGEALVRFFIQRYKTRCDELQVGTQVANIPSMRLYEKCGFSVVKTAYVLHKHVKSRVPAAAA